MPAVCATDTSGPYPLSSKVNGIWATVTRATCSAIVADQTANLATGNFPLDGIRDPYRNAYLVADAAGRLRSYVFGQASPSWTVALGGSPSGPATTASRSLMVPVNKSASDCNGHCVAFYDFGGGSPSFRCNLRSSALVTAGAAVEVPVGGRSRFPDYVFFATPNGVVTWCSATKDFGTRPERGARVQPWTETNDFFTKGEVEPTPQTVSASG